MNKLGIGCFLLLILTSCQNHKSLVLDADQIIDKTILVSGGNIIDASVIAFKFRDKQYKATRKNGLYEFDRRFLKDSNRYKDVMTNNGFQRFANELPIVVADSMATKYTASVNSVHYFSVLPYGLKGDAVNKKLLGNVKLKNETYFKVEITFNEQGGGEDYEDVFVYWINSESFKVDYLAYSYNESDGLGFRFREAFNERYVEGIRFVDYNNYKPEITDTSVYELDALFESGKLKLVSKIELEDILVNHE